MMRISFRPALYISGVLVVVLSILMTLPIMVDLRNGFEEWREFSKSQMISAFFGICLMLINRQTDVRLSQKETLLAATLPWIIVAIFAALPFSLAVNLNLSRTESLFEAVSGLTTTGSTVIIGLTEVSKGVILWRSLLSWLGGIGFLMLSLAIFPFLEIAGMQSFNAYSSTGGQVTSAARKVIGVILLVYTCLTTVCFILLKLNGLESFDAFCLSLSTISTGGFNTSDRSLTSLGTMPVQVVLMIFMVLSTLPFLTFLRLARGAAREAAADLQIRVFITLVIAFAVLLAAENMIANGSSLGQSLFSGLFLSISALSTTGFHTGDHATWGAITYFILFVAMFVGGCAGSSASGFKIFRVHILAQTMATQMKRLIQPNSVFEARYGGRPLESPLQLSVATFFCIFMLTWVFLSFALALTGVNMPAAFFSTAGALTNMPLLVGSTADMPGYAGTFNGKALGILTFTMLAGRLEILVLFSLLLPRFWRS